MSLKTLSTHWDYGLTSFYKNMFHRSGPYQFKMDEDQSVETYFYKNAVKQ